MLGLVVSGVPSMDQGHPKAFPSLFSADWLHTQRILRKLHTPHSRFVLFFSTEYIPLSTLQAISTSSSVVDATHKVEVFFHFYTSYPLLKIALLTQLQVSAAKDIGNTWEHWWTLGKSDQCTASPWSHKKIKAYKNNLPPVCLQGKGASLISAHAISDTIKETEQNVSLVIVNLSVL